MEDKKKRKEILILNVMKNAKDPLSSSRVAEELASLGHEISERTRGGGRRPGVNHTDNSAFFKTGDEVVIVFLERTDDKSAVINPPERITRRNGNYPGIIPVNDGNQPAAPDEQQG